MKTALKQTAIFTIMLMALASCSEQEAIAPKKDAYTIMATGTAIIATGLYEGNFVGDVAIAEQYLGASQVVASGATVSVQVAKGETLFVQLDCKASLVVTIKKNGAEVMAVRQYTGKQLLIVANK